MKKRIVINGRFVGRRVTGVERYALELLKAMDDLLHSDGDFGSLEVVLAVPPSGAEAIPALRSIRSVVVGRYEGQLWEQLELPRYSHSAVILCLTNSAPIISARRSWCVIHDAAIYDMKASYKLSYRLFHYFLDFFVARFGRVLTVSEFSRSRLCEALTLSADRISIAPNGAEHVAAIRSDANALIKFGLNSREYFLCVGSAAASKNVRLAIEAFASGAGEGKQLVITGSRSGSAFSSDGKEISNCSSVQWVGRVSDEELMALYENTCGLVSPSLYEGFGIPPLEAGVKGAPLVLADIPVYRELYGDLAIFFDPSSVIDLTRALKDCLNERTRLSSDYQILRLQRQYSWVNSARRLLSSLVN
jgi:glycosyltransferase involved in cell wall biosynthesis